MEHTVRLKVDIMYGHWYLASASKAFDFPFTPKGNCFGSAEPFTRIKLRGGVVHDFDRKELLVTGLHKIELEVAIDKHERIVERALLLLKEAVRLQWTVDNVDDEDLKAKFEEATREA